jgi:hypothetical protein
MNSTLMLLPLFRLYDTLETLKDSWVLFNATFSIRDGIGTISSYCMQFQAIFFPNHRRGLVFRSLSKFQSRMSVGSA